LFLPLFTFRVVSSGRQKHGTHFHSTGISIFHHNDLRVYSFIQLVLSFPCVGLYLNRCLCDSSWEVGLGANQTQEPEYFGANCGFRHCPSGDDPVTLNVVCANVWLTVIFHFY
jgi:hypothetical protein